MAGITIENINSLKDAKKIILQTHEGDESKIFCFGENEISNHLVVEHKLLDNEGGELPNYAALIIEDTHIEEVWQSIVAILEVGDILKIRWCRGTYTTPEMLPCNLVGDGVEIEIESEARRLVFLLLLHVAPKDSKNRIFKNKEKDTET